MNLTRLRALAKRLKTQQDLARGLWTADDTAAQLPALLICERLEVLKDHPASPGCTSRFAPVWIAAMVRRRHADTVA